MASFLKFPPSNRNALFKKKNVSGVLCITPAEGLYSPSGGLFFFLRLGPLKEKDFNILKSGRGALRKSCWVMEEQNLLF